MDLNVTVPEITVQVVILPQTERLMEALELLGDIVSDQPWNDDAKEVQEILKDAIENGQVVYEG